jgi:iron complex transport system substrate-binding protein
MEDISRRSFVQFGRDCVITLAAGATLANVAGCDSIKETGDAVLLGKQTIVDDWGRELTIPAPGALERVYFTSGLAMIYCFSLEPALLGGVSSSFKPEQLKYLPAGIEKLPAMGALSGEEGNIDREMILKQGIQLIFSISGVALSEANFSDAERLQTQTNIPVVLIDGSFSEVANAYRLLGTCMGRVQRAEEIALYLEDIYARVQGAVAQVPKDERVRIYYAEGPLGLNTEPNTSQHAVAFQEAGGTMVAEVNDDLGLGMVDVSLEQVITWDPELIIAWDDKVQGGADEIIRENHNWATIKAVREGKVYTMPNNPFAWCDRPPGVNRWLGIQWMANLFYPKLYDVNMIEVVRDFYQRLYWVEQITDEEIQDMLGNSYSP